VIALFSHQAQLIDEMLSHVGQHTVDLDEDGGTEAVLPGPLHLAAEVPGLIGFPAGPVCSGKLVVRQDGANVDLPPSVPDAQAGGSLAAFTAYHRLLVYALDAILVLLVDGVEELDW
jgi:hypothetical protein